MKINLCQYNKEITTFLATVEKKSKTSLIKYHFHKSVEYFPPIERSKKTYRLHIIKEAMGEFTQSILEENYVYFHLLAWNSTLHHSKK